MSEARSFEELVRVATGFAPYPYQARLAAEGLPEVLAVPTGAGKTVAAVLPWLYRRRFHPDPEVRASTPRWLVFVLPMRVLAEQTVSNINSWLANLGLADAVACNLLMGGEPRTNPWRMTPETDRVIVGTLDMIVSRQLNRGYGESRFVWPIDFGLFNNGCQFVFDEIQLMGAALATSRQLHGLRAKLGTAASCGSMWMSATVDERLLATFDAPRFDVPIQLGDADRTGALARRLDATRRVQALEVDGRKVARDVAAHAAALHRPGTLTLVIHNTVDRARQTHDELARSGTMAELVLLHSRFRPKDRAVQVARALGTVDPTGPGRIIVSTQVVEAGVDISAAVLVTEAAPWPSIVQRAGRCNRDGLTDDAVLAWFEPPKPLPYPLADIAATVVALKELTDTLVTSTTLRERVVPVTNEPVPVLRRKDLLDLFDTAPDLSGNDIDVARFIRDADDLDVYVAWRTIEKDGPGERDALPTRDERCPVPVADARALLGEIRLWTYDHLVSRWRIAASDDVRPGATFVLDSSAGRYTASAGWSPASREPVDAVGARTAEASEPPDDRSMEDDPASIGERWVSLRQHLVDVEEAVNSFRELITTPGLDDAHWDAAATAGRYHDIGKAHPAFQQMLRSTAGDPPVDSLPPAEQVLAKSAGPARGRYEEPRRRYFRHELASALALDGEGAVALEGCAEPGLVTYLVAAHHGRIRLGCRSHPQEHNGTILGIDLKGDDLPAIRVPGGTLGACSLDVSLLGLGAADGRSSWTARALALRDRADIGPFRLAFLEAVVRLADWQASANPGDEPEWSDDA